MTPQEIIPPLLREGLKRAGGLLPRAWRLGPGFRRTLSFLRESGRWERGDLRRYQEKRLREVLSAAGERVPYYRRLFRTLGLRPNHLRSPRILAEIPLLERETVRENPADFLDPSFDPGDLVLRTTGGSSGRQLSFHAPRGHERKELAFAFDLWSRVGCRPESRIAVLRGSPVRRREGDRPWRYDPLRRELLLSVYDLDDETALRYLREMRRFRTRFLHSYPSAALALARAAERAGAESPPLGAVLTSSENVSAEEREFISSRLKTRVFDLYGQTEGVALAGECERSRLYHVYPQYGWTEIVGEDGKAAEGEGAEGEIVGTGFLNPAMPLVRYRTGDWAVAAGGDCPCGRAYPLWSRVVGRRNRETIVGRGGRRVPLAAINPHSGIFGRVRRYQFVQEEAGKLVLALIRDEGFGESDAAAIRAEIGSKLAGAAELSLRMVESIPLTERGKHLPFLQKIAP